MNLKKIKDSVPYIKYNTNDEEDFYRKKLSDLIDSLGLYDSIVLPLTSQQSDEIVKKFGIRVPASQGGFSKLGYYLRGWADDAFAKRSDAVVLSNPESNNYGYAGETDAVIDKVPAKYLYELFTKSGDFEFRGGMIRNIKKEALDDLVPYLVEDAQLWMRNNPELREDGAVSKEWLREWEGEGFSKQELYAYWNTAKRSSKIKDSNEFMELNQKVKKFVDTLPLDEVSSYYSDIYFKKTPKSVEFVNSLKDTSFRLGGSFTSIFIDNIDNEPWFEIIGANPYFDVSGKEKPTTGIGKHLYQEW